MAPISVVVAGTAKAPLTAASVQALEADPRVSLRGVVYRPLRPDDVAGIDVLVSAAHAYHIGKAIRDAPRLGAVGLHPSLLPAYRGSHPLWWMLRDGRRKAGLTLYRLEKGFDDGPVIAQVPVAIERFDSFGTLYGRVAAEVGPMLGGLIDAIDVGGAIPPGTPQDETLATVVRSPNALEFQLWRATRRLARMLFLRR